MRSHQAAFRRVMADNVQVQPKELQRKRSSTAVFSNLLSLGGLGPLRFQSRPSNFSRGLLCGIRLLSGNKITKHEGWHSGASEQRRGHKFSTGTVQNEGATNSMLVLRLLYLCSFGSRVSCWSCGTDHRVCNCRCSSWCLRRGVVRSGWALGACLRWSCELVSCFRLVWLLCGSVGKKGTPPPHIYGLSPGAIGGPTAVE